MIGGNVPDPFGAVSDHDFLLRAFPAAVPGFQIESRPELAWRFDGGDISRRVGIADSVALPVPSGLGKNTTDFGFAGVRGFSLHLARTAFGLRLHYRDTSAVHLHVQDGYRLAHHDGQIQLQGALNFLLLASADIGSDGFGGSFHGFGCHFEAGTPFDRSRVDGTGNNRPLAEERRAGQQFDLLASMVEWGFRADQRPHAADTG